MNAFKLNEIITGNQLIIESTNWSNMELLHRMKYDGSKVAKKLLQYEDELVYTTVYKRDDKNKYITKKPLVISKNKPSGFRFEINAHGAAVEIDWFDCKLEALSPIDNTYDIYINNTGHDKINFKGDAILIVLFDRVEEYKEYHIIHKRK